MKVRKLKKQETRAEMPTRGNSFPRVLAVGTTAVVIAVMMILAATPGLAETIEGWGDAELIEADDGSALEPQVAMDRDGNAIAVWFQFDGARNNIWSNRYVVGVGWGDAQLIETDDANAEHPQVAMNGEGDAVAVWRQFDGYHNNIWSNRYVVGDGWGDALIIGLDPIMPAGDADWPQVAMDGDGNAVAVWQVWMGTQQSIWSNQYVVGAGWYYASPIGYAGGDYRSPQVAMDGGGNAVAVWHQWDGKNILSNRYVVGDGWGDAELIETNDGDAYDPQVAVDGSGNAVAVWGQWDGGQGNIYSNRYVVGIGWGDAELIETGDQGAHDPQVAMDADGNAIAVWVQTDSTGTDANIWSNQYVADVGWGEAQPIETEDGFELGPQVAVDGDGNAIAVWEQWDATPSIWSNRYVAGAGWGDAQPIEAEDGNANYPQVAMDGDGNAIAVWGKSDGTSNNIWSNRFTSLDTHHQHRHCTGTTDVDADTL
jgi:hypothetical protein